ncbi:MAG: hypothetical protein ACQSGP_22905 [Frankia sp.]
MNPPPDAAAPSLLEERYRALLRLLPASYRAAWEDDMVATFLESTQGVGGWSPSGVAPDGEPEHDEADLAVLRWSEIASVVVLAVDLRLAALRLRLGAAGAPPGRAQWGDGVRLVALIGLLTQGILGALGLVAGLWTTGRIPGIAAPQLDGLTTTPSVWELAWDCGIAWTVAYLALVLDRRRLARAVASGTALATLTHIAYDLAMVSRGPESFGATLLKLSPQALMTVVPVLALFAGFHRDAPPPRRGVWLAVLPAAVVAELGLLLGARLTGGMWLLDESGQFCVALVVAAAVGASVRARTARTARTGRRHARTGPGQAQPASPALALALLTPVVLGLRLLTLAQDRLLEAGGIRNRLLTAGIAETASVATVGVIAALIAAHSVRD